jgi:hypothetical protein
MAPRISLSLTACIALALLSLTTPSAALNFNLRHRKAPRDAPAVAAAAEVPDLLPRQNGAAPGIPPASSPVEVPTLSAPSPPPDPNPTNPSSADDLPPGASVNEPMGEIDSYIFPYTIIQVPVATICPGPDGSASLPVVSMPTALSSSVSGVVNATAVLANGSSVVYSSTVNTMNAGVATDYLPLTPTTTTSTEILEASAVLLAVDAENATMQEPANPTARILLADDGCQTIFSPVYTAVCSTTGRLVGIPDATVSDCGQFVTFSSDARCGATPIPLAGEAAPAAGPIPPPVTTGGSGDGNGSLPILTAEPGTYYAAHWLDVKMGGVMRNVRVEECTVPAPGAGTGAGAVGGEMDCVTHRESWSVRTITGVREETTVAAFSGVSSLSSSSPCTGALETRALYGSSFPGFLGS